MTYEEKTKKLQEFLEDFGAVEDALLVAIDKDRKASQAQKTNTLVSVFSVIIALISATVAVLAFIYG